MLLGHTFSEKRLEDVYNEKKWEYFTSMLNAINLFKYFRMSAVSRRIVPVGESGSVAMAAASIKQPVVDDPSNLDYQLKLPIAYNIWLHRRWKVNFLDTENYGELIAAHLGRKMYPQDEKGLLVPEVLFFYDQKQKNVIVASHYLKSDATDGARVDDLTRYTDKVLNNDTTPPQRKFKYYNYITDPSNRKNINDVSVKQLDPAVRQGIAKAMVLSAVLGDHDVNPGNMLVVKRKGADVVGKIDFGHAFNGLIQAPARFGGQRRNKDNYILDFLNRETVANFPKPAQSKVWRNYSGFIPSDEMASALEQVDSSNIESGIASAIQEFKDLKNALDQNKDKQGIRHLTNTLAGIYKNITGKPLANNNFDEVLTTLFTTIKAFVSENCKQAKESAQIMRLQLRIDTLIHQGKSQEEMLQMLQEEYKKIAGEKPKITWIKYDAEKPAFEGDMAAYIQQRLGVQKPQHTPSILSSLFGRTSRVVPVLGKKDDDTEGPVNKA